MAEGEVTAPADNAQAAAGGGKKKDANRQRILIGGTVALVVLTFILVKRSSAQASSGAATTSGQAIPQYNLGSQNPYGDGTYSGSGAIDPSTGQPFAYELQALQQQVALDSATGQSSSTQTTGSTYSSSPVIPAAGSYGSNVIGGTAYSIIPNPTIANADYELGIPVYEATNTGYVQVAQGQTAAGVLTNNAGQIPLFTGQPVLNQTS